MTYLYEGDKDFFHGKDISNIFHKLPVPIQKEIKKEINRSVMKNF